MVRWRRKEGAGEREKTTQASRTRSGRRGPEGEGTDEGRTKKSRSSSGNEGGGGDDDDG